MPSVDNRIVKMEFDNAAFERKLQGTLASLGKLEKSLEFKGAAKGLSGISNATNNFDGSKMASAIQSISNKFSALGAIGFTVIQSLTRSALDFAKKVGGDILEPIIGGGKTRATNIENAKFQFRGLGIDIEMAMEASLKAVKGTAFGLDVAAKAAAQFGASGITAGADMTQALRGIAGVAAMTNTSFSEIADIFTSSAATGIVNNQDLQQFATRGLNATAALAKQFGITELAVKEMASEGKLDFATFSKAMDDAFGEHATKANETYTGALANMRAALSRLGASFFGPRMEQQKNFFNALTPVIDNVNEALQPLIKTFLLFTGIQTNKAINMLNKLDLTKFKLAVPEIAGGLMNSYKAFAKILTVIKKAFFDIFPKSEMPKILALAKAFRHFTTNLMLSKEAAATLRTIFKGVFSVLSIGWTIITEGTKFIRNLVVELFGLTGGPLVKGLTTVAEFFTNLQKSLVKGGGIMKFFSGLTTIISGGIPFLKKFAEFLKGIFTGFKPEIAENVSKSLGRIGDRFESLRNALKFAGRIWEPFQNAMEKVLTVLDTIWGGIRDWFKELGQKIANVMGKGDFNAVLDLINVSLLGGITALLAMFFKKGFKFDLGNGLFDQIGQTFEQLTGVLTAMQANLKANALMKIAGAIAILTASVLVLSLIDSVALTKSLTAMSVGFGQLLGAFAVLTKLSLGPASAASFVIIATGMIVLSAAIFALGLAVKLFSTMDAGELAKGLTGVTVALTALTVASKPLSANSKGMISAGIGVLAIATALIVLGIAMKIFATMSWGEMVKGLAGVAGGLTAIALGMQLMPKNLILTGLGLVAVAIALNILAGAMKIFATMSWGEIGKGLVAIAGALVIIGVAMHGMPVTLPITAAGLVLVGIALAEIAGAMKLFATMSWSEIGKGLVAMAGALIILAVATNAMTGALLGAAAIYVVSAALLILFAVVKAMSTLSWEDLLKGLVGIAAALAVLAIAAALMTPVLPQMLALGLALTLIGAGAALIGVGVNLIAKAFAILAESGKEGAEAIVGILEAIGHGMGAISRGLAQGLVDFVLIIAKAAPVIMKAVGELLDHLINTIVKLIPKVAKALSSFIDAALKLFNEKMPLIITAGIKFIVSLLTGIRNNIYRITILVGEIVIEFLNALTEKTPEFVTAGTDLLVAFLNGIADNISRVVEAVGNIITAFIAAIAAQYVRIFTAGVDALLAFVKGISDNVNKVVGAVTNLITSFITAVGNSYIRIVNAAVNMVIKFVNTLSANAYRLIAAVTTLITTFITAVGNAANRIVTAGANVIIKFVEGLGKNASRVVQKGVDAVLKFIEGLGKNALRLARGAADVVIDFINGLATALREKRKELEDAGKNLVGAVLDGMTMGLASKGKEVLDKVGEFAGNVAGKAKSALRVVGDPYSLVFMGIGESMMNGMSMALDADTSVGESSEGVVNRATETFKNSLNQITESLGSLEEFNPIITPVLDLTRVANDASKISDYIAASQSLSPSVSLTQAKTIAAHRTEIESGTSEKSPEETSGVKFEQNIYAPEQLSTSEIYKQTRNQIAMAKEELSIS